MVCVPRTRPLCALVLVLCTVGSGCATDQQRTVAECTASGVVLGAIAGYFLGGNRGVAPGTLIGGAVGYECGQSREVLKEAYRQREAELTAVAEDSQRIADEAHAYNAQVILDIAELQRERKQLRARRMAASVRHQQQLQQRQRAGRLLDDTQRQLNQVRTAINQQQTAIHAEDNARVQGLQPLPDRQMRDMSSQMELLQAEQHTLENALQQLQAIDARRSY